MPDVTQSTSEALSDNHGIDWVQFLDDLARKSKEPRPEETQGHLVMLCQYANGCPVMVDPRAVLRLLARCERAERRVEEAREAWGTVECPGCVTNRVNGLSESEIAVRHARFSAQPEPDTGGADE